MATRGGTSSSYGLRDGVRILSSRPAVTWPMTKDQVVAAAIRYRTLLREEPERIDPKELILFPGGRRMRAHLTWMCLRIEDMIQDDSKWSKVMRWLGFVQGAMWASGTEVISSLKDDNR